MSKVTHIENKEEGQSVPLYCGREPYLVDSHVSYMTADHLHFVNKYQFCKSCLKAIEAKRN